ncbi:large conductance mechanosensitive channel protein MscL [Demequina muriae]|uniref:Large-conductance mechanosensitive channel n=1 Tax=Demequina muriae TaxID=3051664 RepID=A0ABT8GGK4_9MICO|nr:large conductance mechanosensitive channel protein MscL [Demequina sp. EGI L300058]MDN4480076.1 large conductance mechanosensitive channel protein MscL [Demequina sp. EGI L300058]
MVKGFKDFIARGNVVDLAVAVVIGAAFAMVISAIVDGLITPLIAAIFGEPDLTSVATFEVNGAVFSLGLVLDALFNFLAVAAAIYFLVVVPLNKLAERRKRGEAAPDEPVSPTEIQLLTEIRDALEVRKQP